MDLDESIANARSMRMGSENFRDGGDSLISSMASERGDLAPKTSMKGSIMTAQIVSGHEAKMEAQFFKYKPGFLGSK